MDFITEKLRLACDKANIKNVERLLQFSSEQLDALGLGFLKYHGGIGVVLFKLFPGK